MSMKTKFLLPIFAVFIFSQMVFAQSVEKQITAIRAEVTAINKNGKSYRKTTKDVEGVSLEGTEATYYISGKGLKKIVAKIYGETYRATTEFFYQGENLIFAFKKMERYNTSIGDKKLKVVSIEEERFYFSEAEVIRYLLGKKEIEIGTIKFNDAKNSIIELADKLKSEITQ